MGRIFVGFTLALLLSSCANFNSIHRDLTVDAGNGALIDAKQRAIISSKHTDATTKDVRTTVCAEPSPDALSAYAAELALQARDTHGNSVQGTAAFQESAAFIGLRTQSIQVLRDWMFRNCEAYMNGAIDKYDFDILMRRSEKYMVALLGLESLTGVIKAPNIVINTKGEASIGQSVTSMQDSIKSNNDQITKNNNDIASKKSEKAALSSEDQTGEKGKAIDLDILKLTQDNNDLKSLNDNIDYAIKNAKGLIASGSATSTNTDQINNQSVANISNVADTVHSIVNTIVTSDDTGQICLSYLKQISFTKNDINPSMEAICNQHFADISATNSMNNDIYKAYILKHIELSKTIDDLASVNTDQGILVEVDNTSLMPPKNSSGRNNNFNFPAKTIHNLNSTYSVPLMFKHE